ncbi:MAG: carboxypeptidase regulatory-like domain-containing protein [Acidobacteria bacterium]|nr:carboxypeptidase regulatory-like domain-containing protein [Acidobacteriota bacterium]MBS1866755.1 carboxypeptidase regulatory-like domain-containing protein [Acidobacteriota bacterium]
MKRAVYFCLLLLSWAPHSRATQINLNNRAGRTRNVQGVLMDNENLPVKDTLVRLWSDPERGKMVLERKTDEEGRFRLMNVERGTYFLEILGPGFYSCITEIHVSGTSSATGLMISPLVRGVAAGGGG